MTVDAVVGLGASLGEATRSMALAVAMVDARADCEVVKTSRVYRSVAMGPSRRMFFNSAIRIRTTLSPESLLGVLKENERRIGRRRTIRWGDRLIDLDILLFGSVVMNGDDLVLPHPGLCVRRFALIPAVEVAPDLWHPIERKSLGSLPLPGGSQVISSAVLPAAVAGIGLQR